MGEGEEEEEEEEGVGVGAHGCAYDCGCGCGREVFKEVGWGFEWRGWWWWLVEEELDVRLFVDLISFLGGCELFVCNLHKFPHCVLCLAIFPGSKIWSLFPLTIVPSPPYHVLLRVGARAFVDFALLEFSLR